MQSPTQEIVSESRLPPTQVTHKTENLPPADIPNYALYQLLYLVLLYLDLAYRGLCLRSRYHT